MSDVWKGFQRRKLMQGLGPQVGPVTLHFRSSGLVVKSPGELLERYPDLDLDAYSLARMLASEGYGGDPVGFARAHYLMAWSCRNKARQSRRGVTGCLVYPGRCYGRQLGGKYASTWLDPRQWHYDLARAVLAEPLGEDPVRGGQSFYSPKVQDGGIQAGTSLGRDALEVLEQWGSAPNLQAWGGPVGTIDAYHLAFLYREPRASARAAKNRCLAAVIRCGRNGRCEPWPHDWRSWKRLLFGGGR